jgi:hypothetical protein
VTPCGALANSDRVFSRLSPCLRATYHVNRFSRLTLRSLLGLGCSTCCFMASRPWAMQPSYCFRGATATHWLRDREMSLDLGSRDCHPGMAHPMILLPARGHSEAILILAHYSCRPPWLVGVRDRKATSGFESRPFCRSRLPTTDFLGTRLLMPSSSLRSTTRPCLRAPMGGAVAPAAEPAWLVPWTCRPCIRMPPNHASDKVIHRRPDTGVCPTFSSRVASRLS